MTGGKKYWAGKKQFQDINITLVDWTMIKKVIKSQTIYMQRWTTKFVMGFCAAGSRMVYQKQRPTADCPCCGKPQEDTTHILQCPQQESQCLWDITLLELCEHLLQADTDPDLIEDLGARLDAWRKQSPPPPAITNVGHQQFDLTWENLAHGFLSTKQKLHQAGYYNSKGNPASPATWAANLLWNILKIACQQWDQCNEVLHKLQPNWVKDLQLDTDIRLQYNQGCDMLPQASKVLLN